MSCEELYDYRKSSETNIFFWKYYCNAYRPPAPPPPPPAPEPEPEVIPIEEVTIPDTN
jgi:hypothetical protein